MENKGLGRLGKPDFEQLKIHGRKIAVNPWLLLVYTSTSEEMTRLAVTVPRRVGSAVTRNRLKRWCRNFAVRKMRQSEKKWPNFLVNVIFRLESRQLRDEKTNKNGKVKDSKKQLRGKNKSTEKGLGDLRYRELMVELESGFELVVRNLLRTERKDYGRTFNKGGKFRL